MRSDPRILPAVLALVLLAGPAAAERALAADALLDRMIADCDAFTADNAAFIADAKAKGGAGLVTDDGMIAMVNGGEMLDGEIFASTTHSRVSLEGGQNISCSLILNSISAASPPAGGLAEIDVRAALEPRIALLIGDGAQLRGGNFTYQGESGVLATWASAGFPPENVLNLNQTSRAIILDLTRRSPD